MKDARYDTVRDMLEVGAIRKFSDIFTWIPKTIIRKHIATSGQRMDKLKENPAWFTLHELYQIADLIGYDKKKLVNMALEEMDAIDKENPSILKHRGK